MAEGHLALPMSVRASVHLLNRNSSFSFGPIFLKVLQMFCLLSEDVHMVWALLSNYFL